MDAERESKVPEAEGQDAPGTALPSGGFAEGIGTVLSDPELMAKLPQIMAMLRPMMAQGTATAAQVPAPHTGDGTVASSIAAPVAAQQDHRSALLLALKPFLSEDRQRAVDAMLRLSKLGDVLRQL